MKIPKKWKKIKAYGIVMPDGIMLGEFHRYKNELNGRSGIISKIVKVEIKVTKIY